MMWPEIDPDRDFLGVIDVQPTFMPGGELPVAQGDEVVAVINGLFARTFARGFATQDWHPPGHASFARTHPGRAPFDVVESPHGPQTLWPDHAIQGTASAALHPGLDTRPIELVIRKGTRREIDSYSAFLENDRRTPTGLAAALRELDARRLFLVGLALDVCVVASAEHAVLENFETFIIEDATRPIAAPLVSGGTTLDAAYARLRRAGVTIIPHASDLATSRPRRS